MEGIPPGYIPKRFGKVEYDEPYLNLQGKVETWDGPIASSKHYLVLEKLPPTYRPFKDHKEFEPYRNQWWRFKHTDDISISRPPAAYSMIDYAGKSWKEAFNELVFDDGTPFGAPDA